MSAQVTFETNYFQPVPGEDERTNPGIYGQQISDWFREQLIRRGVEVEEALPEDFGWVLVISRNPFLLWIGCANVGESESEWMVYAVAEPSLFQRLFKRVDTQPALDELERQLRELVPTIPGVRNIVWV